MLPGSADLVHPGDGLGAVGEGGDGGHASDLVEGIDVGDFGGGHDGGIEGLSLAAGGGEGDFADTGDPGGDGGHQDGGGISGGTAGGVETDTFDGADKLSQSLLQVNPMAGKGSLMEFGDALGGEFQSLDKFAGKAGSGFGDFIPVDAEVGEFDAIQDAGVVADGGVAVTADVLNNADDGLFRGDAIAEHLAGSWRLRRGATR